MKWALLGKDRYRAAVSKFRKFVEDCRGLAAIEFAFIAPVMIVVYMGAVEVSQVLTLERRITAIASATSDLVAQEQEIDNPLITDIFTAASSMIVPYDPVPVTIVVTSIQADPNTGNTTVAWSDAFNTGARTPDAAITVPAGLLAPGECVVMTEVSYAYNPIIGHVIQQGFTVEDRFYVKPRRTLCISRI